MPELPEVETVRRGLEPVLSGRRIVRAEQRRADLRWPLPERLAQRLTGRQILGLRRRSKWILVDLDGDETWMIHLGMTGRMLISGDDGGGEQPGQFVHDPGRHPEHDHVIVETDAGATITYNDVRRFGAMDLWRTSTLAEHPQLATLGPEPLGNSFNGAALESAFSGRQSPVKAVLLDQRTVAGLGNIYVCEALFRAGIHPRRIAASISAPRVHALAAEIVATLTEAIAAGGSSLRDYRQADGELGYFQHAFRTYGRDGEPCVLDSCNGKVLKIVQSGRSTFYCSKCQR
ncbi:MAG: bifunctional DNA-formamidopyrimidine glycosylase/DNA-(apurinic or apyrimidinic site) lyase [Pseudomonadota bacterium]